MAHSSHRATWPMVMPRIILEFKAKKCWDYVDPDNAPNDNNNNGILEVPFKKRRLMLLIGSHKKNKLSL